MSSINDIINSIEDDTYNLYKSNEDLSLNIKELNNIYKNRTKQNELKKKKAINARELRRRKKISIEILIQENKILKQKIENLENELNQKLCNECKKKINSNYCKLSSSNIKKKIIFFTTLVGLIFLYYFSSNNNVYHNYRKLKETFKNEFKLSKDDILNSKMISNGIYIQYKDYYSIIHGGKVFGKKYFSFINEIKEIKENDLIYDMNPDDCENCMIKLNSENIKIHGLFQFSLYLNPRFLKTPLFNKTFKNKTFDGKTYFTFYELNVTGYSINQAITNDKNYKNIFSNP